MFNFNYFKNKYNAHVEDMIKTNQSKEWHAEGNVAIHTEMVINEVLKLEEFKLLNNEEQEILLYAAFFHDIAKFDTTVLEEKNGKLDYTSPNHSKIGAKKTRNILYKENFDFQKREQICALVKYHGFPIFAFSKKDADYYKVSLECNMNLLYLLAKADMSGRITRDPNEISKKLDDIEYFKEYSKELNCYTSGKSFNSVYEKMYFFKNNHMYDPYKLPESKVFILSGVMGVGKDFYIKNNLKDLPVISLDALRLKYKARYNDKKIQGQIIQEAKELAKKYMREKVDFVWNATNLTKDMRDQLISLFWDYNIEIHIIYIEKDIKTILKQNNNREHKVPEKTILDIIRKIDVPLQYEAHFVKYIIN